MKTFIGYILIIIGFLLITAFIFDCVDYFWGDLSPVNNWFLIGSIVSFPIGIALIERKDE